MLIIVQCGPKLRVPALGTPPSAPDRADHPREGAMASGDPFEGLYAQVSSALTSLQEEHEGLLTAPSEAERSALRNELGALQWDVQDLKEAVAVAAGDPARFGAVGERGWAPARAH